MEDVKCIYVLSGVDKSLVGLEIDGWCIKAAHKRPFSEDDYLIPEKPLFPQILELIYCICMVDDYQYLHCEENPYYIYLVKHTDNIYTVNHVISSLRLFRNCNVGAFSSFLFRGSNAPIVNSTPSYYTPRLSTFLPLALSNEEKNELIDFSLLVNNCKKEYIIKMLEIYHESFRTDNRNIAFILRIMILEMLIEGNAELSFRIARSVAVLLGKNEDESKEIHAICKKMYAARSKYLHEGLTKDITEEIQNNALDISRRVLANLCVINKDINEIREQLYRAGYGSNPYQIKF